MRWPVASQPEDDRITEHHTEVHHHHQALLPLENGPLARHHTLHLEPSTHSLGTINQPASHLDTDNKYQATTVKVSVVVAMEREGSRGMAMGMVNHLGMRADLAALMMATNSMEVVVVVAQGFRALRGMGRRGVEVVLGKREGGILVGGD